MSQYFYLNNNGFCHLDISACHVVPDVWGQGPILVTKTWRLFVLVVFQASSKCFSMPGLVSLHGLISTRQGMCILSMSCTGLARLFFIRCDSIPYWFGSNPEEGNSPHPENQWRAEWRVEFCEPGLFCLMTTEGENSRTQPTLINPQTPPMPPWLATRHLSWSVGGNIPATRRCQPPREAQKPIEDPSPTRVKGEMTTAGFQRRRQTARVSDVFYGVTVCTPW